jgi:hypothetical protein
MLYKSSSYAINIIIVISWLMHWPCEEFTGITGCLKNKKEQKR